MRYRRTVLDAGATKPAAELVKDFLGRPQNMKALETLDEPGIPASPGERESGVAGARRAFAPALRGTRERARQRLLDRIEELIGKEYGGAAVKDYATVLQMAVEGSDQHTTQRGYNSLEMIRKAASTKSKKSTRGPVTLAVDIGGSGLKAMLLTPPVSRSANANAWRRRPFLPRVP